MRTDLIEKILKIIFVVCYLFLGVFLMFTIVCFTMWMIRIIAGPWLY